MIARAAALALVLAAPAAAADFAKDIQPILQGRCYECHGAKKQKAGMRLDSPEAILKGGKTGPAVVAGDPAKSPLYVRISLPAGDDDIMPPKGEPLTAAQQESILAWIKAGAAMAATPGGDAPGMGETTMAPSQPEQQPAPAHPVDAKAGDGKSPVVVADSRKNLPPIPDTDLDALAAGVAAPDAHALELLKGFGVWSRVLTRNGALLELDYRQLKGPVTAEMLKPLGALADNVAWLDFAGSGVTDRDLTHLRPLKRLSSLHLERTAITDKGLAELAGLGELRYLNLYGTKVTDNGLHQLEALGKLQALYLWQTAATPAGGDALAKAIPGLAVSFGDTLPDPPRNKDEAKEERKRGKKKN